MRPGTTVRPLRSMRWMHGPGCVLPTGRREVVAVGQHARDDAVARIHRVDLAVHEQEVAAERAICAGGRALCEGRRRGGEPGERGVQERRSTGSGGAKSRAALIRGVDSRRRGCADISRFIVLLPLESPRLRLPRSRERPSRRCKAAAAPTSRPSAADQHPPPVAGITHRRSSHARTNETLGSLRGALELRLDELRRARELPVRGASAPA